MRYGTWTALFCAMVIGCQPTPPVVPAPPPVAEVDEEVAAERAKLSPEDRALVEAQEYCVISDEQHLGQMGPPIKLLVKGQPVFICCKGCERKVLAKPDEALAKLAELKAKKSK